MTTPALIPEATTFLGMLPEGLPAPQVFPFLGEAGVVWFDKNFNSVEVKVYSYTTPDAQRRGKFLWGTKTNGVASAGVIKDITDDIGVGSVVKAVKRLLGVS